MVETFGRGDAIGWKISGRTEYNLTPLKLSEPEEKLFSLLVREYGERKQDTEENDLRGELEELLRELCEENDFLLNTAPAEKILSVAESNIGGFGVLDALLKDDSLEEITVVGVDQPIRVFHRQRGWLETNACITSEEFAVNVVNKMARPLGRRVTYQNPRLNAVLPDGSRLHASIPPISLNGVELTIRKFREKPFTARDLADNNTISTEALAFLWTALYADVSLLIAGTTGSGKTTTLNALFSFIPLTDRVVITEETPEINILHPHKVRVIANEELGIKMKDLVKDTLRMRPDRVIVGEVRDEDEVRALFDSLLAGQARGSYATFHAASASEALTRLRALGARAEDLKAIDLVLVQHRISFYDSREKKQKELRRVTEISEVTEKGLAPLFSFNPSKQRLEKTKHYANSRVLDRVLVNYGCNKKQLLKEIERRKRFLEAQLPAGYADFTRAVQKYLFE